MLYLACLLKQLTSLCSYRYKQKIAHSGTMYMYINLLKILAVVKENLNYLIII